MAPDRFDSDSFYVALDASGAVGHVAVSRGPEVLARARLDHRGQHAGALIPALHRSLENAGVGRDQIAGVVVGEGPGSFTGVRVAAATAKGLARALRVPLWAVSSLAAAAITSWDRGSAVVRYVLFDARADRVYAGCYGMGGRGMQTLVAPHATDLRSVLASEVPPGAEFVGDGSVKHAAAIQGAGFGVLEGASADPTGDGLIAFLAIQPDTSPVETLETWEPRYLKPSSAERAPIA
jgi:tRNA threonylcarbamoyl adenosine modification protein YeaZ